MIRNVFPRTGQIVFYRKFKTVAQFHPFHLGCKLFCNNLVKILTDLGNIFILLLFDLLKNVGDKGGMRAFQ